MYDVKKWNEERKSLEAEIKDLKWRMRTPEECDHLDWVWDAAQKKHVVGMVKRVGCTYREQVLLADLKMKASMLYCGRTAMKAPEHQHSHGVEACYPEDFLPAAATPVMSVDGERPKEAQQA